MSSFGYDFPIFNWVHSSDPLGTILDASDSNPPEGILDYYVEDEPPNDEQFECFLEYCRDPKLSILGKWGTVGRNIGNPMRRHSIDFPKRSVELQHPLPCMEKERKRSASFPSYGDQGFNSIETSETSVDNSPHYGLSSSEPMDTDEEDFNSTGPLLEELSEENGETFEKEISKVKLQASKSPIMDALVYCALNRWGIELIEENGDTIRFRVLDFQKYYKYSGIICAKQNPTEDIASRIKALKRWFPDFPTKRAGNLEEAFEITVQLPSKSDNKPQKLHEIIDKQRRLLGLSQKISRQG